MLAFNRPDSKYSKAMNAKFPASQNNSIRVIVAQSAEEIAHAYVVRSIAFMEGEGLRVNHAFDGNDFQCTHIVTYDGDEPIGAARVRWFKDFAKIERMAFRMKYRNPRALYRMAEFIFEHVAMKGYDRVLTLAEEHYARLWRKRFGFQLATDEVFQRPNQESKFYLLEKRLDVPSDAVTAETPVRIMIRTEGRWDVPLSFG